jgi:thioredoxin 1
LTNSLKLTVIIVLAVLVVAAFYLGKSNGNDNPTDDPQSQETALADSNPGSDENNPPGEEKEPVVVNSITGLPKMLEVGSDNCRPCKMMVPIIDELTEKLDGKLDVEFINVRKDPDAGKPYKVSVIPTQIFLGPDGMELFRHTGFYPMEDILGKWKEFGFDFTDFIEAG